MSPTSIEFMTGDKYKVNEGTRVTFEEVGGRELPRPTTVSVDKKGRTTLKIQDGPVASYFYVYPGGTYDFSEYERDLNLIRRIVHNIAK